MSYQMFVGPIPAGLWIDHLCRVHLCVNPDHLEVVPPGINTLRGINPEVTRLRHAAQTHCKHGHEFTPENTRVCSRGWRSCRTCAEEHRRERRRRAKLARAA